MLVILLQICRAWRAALAARENELWRLCVFTEFPRAVALLSKQFRVSPLVEVAMVPDFRRLYRMQHAARRVPTTPRPEANELEDYLLTVELSRERKQSGQWVPMEAPCSVTSTLRCFEGWGPERLADGLDIPWLSELRAQIAAHGRVCVDWPWRLRFVLLLSHRVSLATVRLVDDCSTLDQALDVDDEDGALHYIEFGFAKLPTKHPGFFMQNNDKDIFARVCWDPDDAYDVDAAATTFSKGVNAQVVLKWTVAEDISVEPTESDVLRYFHNVPWPEMK